MIFAKSKKNYKKKKIMHTTTKTKPTTLIKNKGKSINSVVKHFKISRFISLVAICVRKNAETFGGKRK